MRSPRLGLVSSERWAELSEDERTAVAVLDLHLHERAKQSRYQPFERVDGDPCGVFLTDGYVQGLLERVRARRVSRDYARTIIPTLLRLGILGNTGRTKKPRQRPNEHRPASDVEEGGRDAQTSLHRSKWWRIFTVVPILDVLLSLKVGAYGPKFPRRHRGSASLSRLLRCQGLISKPKRPSDFARGSVQRAFAATGPP